MSELLVLPNMLRLETTQVMPPEESRVSEAAATPQEHAEEAPTASVQEEEEDTVKIRKGRVVWMNNNIGFGFIEDLETGKEYFVHYESIIAPNPEHTQERKGKKVAYKSLANDEMVEFRLEKEDQNDKKMQSARAKGKPLKAYKAVDVTGPDGEPVQGVRKTPDVSTSSCRGRKSRGPTLTASDRAWLSRKPTDFTGSPATASPKVRAPEPNQLPALKPVPSNVSAASSGVSTPYSWGSRILHSSGGSSGIVAMGPNSWLSSLTPHGYHQGRSPHGFVQTPTMMPRLENGSDSDGNGANQGYYPTPFPMMGYQQ